MVEKKKELRFWMEDIGYCWDEKNKWDREGQNRGARARTVEGKCMNQQPHTDHATRYVTRLITDTSQTMKCAICTGSLQ